VRFLPVPPCLHVHFERHIQAVNALHFFFDKGTDSREFLFQNLEEKFVMDLDKETGLEFLLP
jgi:hypothetical protein